MGGYGIWGIWKTHNASTTSGSGSASSIPIEIISHAIECGVNIPFAGKSSIGLPLKVPGESLPTSMGSNGSSPGPLKRQGSTWLEGNGRRPRFRSGLWEDFSRRRVSTCAGGGLA